MRSRISLLAFVLVASSFVFPHLAHAAIPFFGPIIPNAANTCPAGWGLLIVVINRIISLLITLAIVFVAPIMIAYSGFLYVVNPINPAGKEKARGILLNTIVGIVIALASWLIVDAIMAVLYNPKAVGGTWYSLVSSGGAGECLSMAGSLNQTPNGLGITGVSVTGIQYLAPTSGDCSVSSLTSYGISSSIANTMSCIAQNESGCNLTASNPKSSAFGLFQIVNGWNDTGHNLNFPVCTQAAQAAGFNVTGNLNCHTAVVTGGAPNPSRIDLYNACRAASANPTCNSHAAQWLYDHNGGFTNWVAASKCGV